MISYEFVHLQKYKFFGVKKYEVFLELGMIVPVTKFEVGKP
jgi:hypothetical protein